jgi:hypothetical protein
VLCQVFIPKEELSLDVIKQYRVVSGTACPQQYHFFAVKCTCGIGHLDTWCGSHPRGPPAQNLKAAAALLVLAPCAVIAEHCHACAVLQYCPTGSDKVKVLKDMIFPLVRLLVSCY